MKIVPPEKTTNPQVIFNVSQKVNCVSGTFCEILTLADELHISEGPIQEMKEKGVSLLSRVIVQWLDDVLKANSLKGIGIGISSRIKNPQRALRQLASDLWLKSDIIPCFMRSEGRTSDERSDSTARKTILLFAPDFIPRIDIGFRNRVIVDRDCISLLSKEDYKFITSSKLWVSLLEHSTYIKKNNIKISFFNSTAQGGGVAIMRHALVRFLKLLGIDVSWYVMRPVQHVFHITKQKFHNVLQGVSHETLTDDDKEQYEQWIEMNAERFWKDEVFVESDIIVLDDPQVSGLVPHIRQANNECKIIYRSHIQIRSELIGIKESAQHSAWEYLSKNIVECDCFVSHPVESFVPDDIDRCKVGFMPASTDPLDGLNKPLNQKNIDFYVHMFHKICTDFGASKLDFDEPVITQIARFDPSKGIDDALCAYHLVCKMYSGPRKLQLLLCGHSSVDDPEGRIVYKATLKKLDDPKYNLIRDRICIVSLPPSDQLLNVLLRKSTICLQLSYNEGFEIKVTEAILKNIPVIAYKSGGIPLQIEDGKNGFLVDTGSVHAVVDKIKLLLEDISLLKKMSEYESDTEHFLTTGQACDWLYLFRTLLQNKLPNGRRICELSS